jgi:hypothetical protein
MAIPSTRMNSPNKNVIKESFNEDFCAQLEHHLTRIFGKSQDKRLHGFWCDGVLMPDQESQLAKKNVKSTKLITTKAWIGNDGQTAYEMTILFGPNSLQRYAKGADLRDCIPSEDLLDWLTVDMDNKKIEIRLK